MEGKFFFGILQHRSHLVQLIMLWAGARKVFGGVIQMTMGSKLLIPFSWHSLWDGFLPQF